MRHRPEHKHPVDPDSLLAKQQALQHLMSLGLPPQPGQFPSNVSIENTKAIVVKPLHRKARGILLHQIYKTPGT